MVRRVPRDAGVIALTPADRPWQRAIGAFARLSLVRRRSGPLPLREVVD
jgi:hypothetical protein